MLFVGRQYWTHTLPVWPLISALADDGPLAAAARLVDDTTEVHGLLTQA
jgi:hypothetical protein